MTEAMNGGLWAGGLWSVEAGGEVDVGVGEGGADIGALHGHRVLYDFVPKI